MTETDGLGWLALSPSLPELRTLAARLDTKRRRPKPEPWRAVYDDAKRLLAANRTTPTPNEGTDTP